MDLTYANGFIYAVDSEFNSQGVSRIYKIPPTTGLVVGVPQLLHRPNGATTTDAEGLATSADGSLVVSYRALSPDDGTCDAIGLVDPATGQIASEASFYPGKGQSPQFDFDALAADVAGGFWAMDNGADGPGQNFISLTLDPPSAQIVGQQFATTSAANDIVFSASGLFSIRTSGSIQIHDPATGATIGSINYSPGETSAAWR